MRQSFWWENEKEQQVLPMRYTLYRIEDADGCGPYKPSTFNIPNLYRRLYRHCNDPKHHPNPTVDGIRKPCDAYDYFCGFESLQQYHDWFDAGDREALRDAGLLLTVWECKYVLFGGRQVMFKRDDATCIGKELVSV